MCSSKIYSQAFVVHDNLIAIINSKIENLHLPHVCGLTTQRIYKLWFAEAFHWNDIRIRPFQMSKRMKNAFSNYVRSLSIFAMFLVYAVCASVSYAGNFSFILFAGLVCCLFSFHNYRHREFNQMPRQTLKCTITTNKNLLNSARALVFVKMCTTTRTRTRRCASEIKNEIFFGNPSSQRW